MNEHDPKTQLLSDVLESYKEAYRELSEIWRNLDTKAQGVIAVDGIFLAALFAFIRVLVEEPTVDEKWMLTILAGLLFISIGFAIRGLWIESVPSAPLGESLDDLIADLIRLPEGTDIERMHNFSNDHASLWKETNSAIHAVNERKARAVMRAQGTLIMALLGTVFFTIYKIWS